MRAEAGSRPSTKTHRPNQPTSPGLNNLSALGFIFLKAIGYQPIPLRFWSRSMKRYRLSTFSRAQGVLRRNLRLEPTLGSL